MFQPLSLGAGEARSKLSFPKLSQSRLGFDKEFSEVVGSLCAASNPGVRWGGWWRGEGDLQELSSCLSMCHSFSPWGYNIHLERLNQTGLGTEKEELSRGRERRKWNSQCIKNKEPKTLLILK